MSQLRIPSVFRNVRKKPKGFQYKSKFYDAKKEEREKRYRAIERSVAIEKGEIDPSELSPKREISFGGARTRLKDQRTGAMRANIRLIIILFILVALTLAGMDKIEALFH